MEASSLWAKRISTLRHRINEMFPTGYRCLHGLICLFVQDSLFSFRRIWYAGRRVTIWEESILHLGKEIRNRCHCEHTGV